MHTAVDDGSGEHLDVSLHPNLTVVRHLSPGARRRFLDTVGRLSVPDGDEAVGEVEASGVVFPLSSASLALLGVVDPPSAVVSAHRLATVDAPNPAEPGLRSGDPLGGDPVPVAFPAQTDQHAPTPDTPLHQLGELPEGDGPAAEVDVALPAAPAEPPQRPRPTPLERRLGALRDRRADLARMLAQVADVEVGGVPAALAELEAAPVGAPVPGAVALADEWADLQKDWRGLEVGATAEEHAALAAVARAQAAVAEAEAVLRKPHLTDDQVQRIEAAHAATTEASDRVERRFGGSRARKQLADAEAEEQRLLERFGFESWVDYMLRTAKRAEDPDRNQEKADLEAARTELEVCIAELDAIPGAVGRRHRRARLKERQEELSDRIAPVLGRQPVGDDVEQELRSLTVRADRSREVAALVTALAAVGVDVAGGDGRRPDADAVAEAARRLLSAVDHAERRRGELEAALAALDDEIDVLADAAASGATEPPDRPRLPDMAEPPAGLLDLLDDVAPEPDGASGPDEDADGVDPDAQAVAARFTTSHTPDGSSGTAVVADGETAGDEVAAGVPEPDASTASEAIDPGDVSEGDPAVPWDLTDREALVDDLHWAALRCIAELRTDAPGGPRPVVLDDPFSVLEPAECVTVLARLARLTDLVQIVVVTDRPEVAEWALAIGPDHAAVVG